MVRRSNRIIGLLFEIARQHHHGYVTDLVRLRYQLHPTVQIGYDTLFYGDGTIRIGRDSHIGNNSFVHSGEGASIVIGEGCAISHGVHIRTERHQRVFHFRDETSQPNQDISIGDYVWIGANCYISGGVAIGENSILGANSVVTHDIPPNMVYGGSPARLIRDKRTYLPAQ